MEEFNEDFRYIVSKQHVTPLLVKENMIANQTPKNGSESVAQKISRYFSMLEESVRSDLYDLYKIDFELFGYDASEFLWTTILCLAIADPLCAILPVKKAYYEKEKKIF